MPIWRNIFILCLVTPFSLSFSVENSDIFKSADRPAEIHLEPLSTYHNDVSLSQEHSKVKINWAPVWDDIEGSNEIVIKYASAKEKCGATPGKGLHNLLEQIWSILSQTEIKNIIHSYAKDPEVKALKQYLQSSDFKTKVEAIENSDEFRILQSYTCNLLHIDILQMANDIKEGNIIQSRDTFSGNVKSSGILGLLVKIDATVPHEELRLLYKRLMKSDEDLVVAVAHLKSEEFEQLVLNLRDNVPAYTELMEKLSSLGVPVDEIEFYIENVL